MRETRYITFFSDKKKIVLHVGTVLYVLMMGNNAYIHTTGDAVYKARMTFREVEEMLGDGFIRIHRGGIVSAMAIHDITDRINLSNGEALTYTQRKKKQIIEQLHATQKRMISSFHHSGIPETEEDYRSYYQSFEAIPFAFTDIEMVFNEKRQAVDWIFRYCNPALARLEKCPWSAWWEARFEAFFPIWIPGGFEAMSVRHCMEKPWKLSIIVLKLTPILR